MISGVCYIEIMTAEERRQRIKEEIQRADGPLAASALADRFGVSRQVIVGDVALLRASGEAIFSTPRGYIAGEEEEKRYTVVCLHREDDMEEELNVMVDNGCMVENVIVEHPVYGQISGELHLRNRYDVGLFLKKVRAAEAAPLSVLTEGIHIHTLCCPEEETFLRTVECLRERGYLYEK